MIATAKPKDDLAKLRSTLEMWSAKEGEGFLVVYEEARFLRRRMNWLGPGPETPMGRGAALLDEWLEEHRARYDAPNPEVSRADPFVRH